MEMQSTTPPTVLITRPAHQAEALITALAPLGVDVMHFPTIEIIPPSNLDKLLTTINDLNTFDIAIFTSVNAVLQCKSYIQDRPHRLNVAAIGQSTANALIDAGITVDITPETNYSSEGLLACDALQSVTGKRIAIFKGKGGRELLSDELKKRGAEIIEAITYERILPRHDISKLTQTWADYIIITSGEALENLHTLLGKQQALLNQSHLIVVSERIAKMARTLQIESEITVSAQCQDDAIINTLKYIINQRSL